MAILTKAAAGHCDFVKEEIKLEDLPLRKRVNYLHSVIIGIPPLVLLLTIWKVNLQRNTMILTILMYILTGFGITGGYHRLWSHKSYDAVPALQYFIAFFAAGAFEGSARWWCRNHRAHHRYADTDKDPYAVHKGFWYAHVGWMIMKQDTKKIGKADISDLNANPALQLQHKYYLEMALMSGVVVPTLIAGLGWNDWMGGFCYAVMARAFFTHHSTFLVNSAAHYFGDRPYSTAQTARDNVITAFLTMGEGYHNFHHEFPHDYRNGVRKWQYDPTKWIIYSLSLFGLTYNLNAYPREDWRKTRIIVKKEQIGDVTPTARKIQEGQIDKEGKLYNWGPKPETLPEMTQKDVDHMVKEEGRTIIICNGIVHDGDRNNWVNDHPGGKEMLKFFSGRDATTAMEGEIYRHSRNALNKMATMAIGRFVEDTRLTIHEPQLGYQFNSILQAQDENHIADEDKKTQ